MPETQTTNPPTFESVWAILKEVAENQKETDRIIKEVGKKQEETDRQLKETDRIVKETSKQIGKFSNRFGEIVEYMVAPNLQEKFWEMGLKFHQANLSAVFSDDKKFLFEVDVFLQNGDKAMLVKQKRNSRPKMLRIILNALKKCESTPIYTATNAHF